MILYIIYVRRIRSCLAAQFHSITEKNHGLRATEHLFNEGYDLKAQQEKKRFSFFRVISIMYR